MQQTSSYAQFKAGTAVDAKGVVLGVSVCTVGPCIGHNIYLDEKTLRTVHLVASGFKDGIKVKADHDTGVNAIIGVLRNFRIDKDRVRADLHLTRSHRDFSYFVELIETQASNIGLSMHFSFTKENIDKKDFVRVLDLYSVDLVSRPAANPSGLFGAGAGIPPKTFGRAVAQLCLQGMTPGRAVEKAVIENTDLWAAWREAGCVESLSTGLDTPGNFVQLVAAQEKHGKSKAEAVRFCVSNFPDSYAAWRASGDTSKL